MASHIPIKSGLVLNRLSQVEQRRLSRRRGGLRLIRSEASSVAKMWNLCGEDFERRGVYGLRANVRVDRFQKITIECIRRMGSCYEI
jgi:hypothetical protein